MKRIKLSVTGYEKKNNNNNLVKTLMMAIYSLGDSKVMILDAPSRYMRERVIRMT